MKFRSILLFNTEPRVIYIRKAMWVQYLGIHMENEAKHPVKTLVKTISIIELMRDTDYGSITRIANELDLNKSVVHRHVSTLEEHGYIVKHDGTYQLGLKFLELGGYKRQKMEFYKQAEPEVEGLAKETGELANLMVEERGRGVYLKRSKGSQAVNLDTYAGLRTTIHSTALGKSILAHLPREYVDKIIEKHGLPKHTENTIADSDRLYEELEEVRARGYSQDDGERLEGLRGVAAPVKTSDGFSLGSISVAAPASRVDNEMFNETLPDLVCSAANVIELNIKY